MFRRFAVILILIMTIGFGLHQINASEFSENVFPWIKENNLTRYEKEGEFRPSDAITRGEASKFVANYASLLSLEKTETNCNFRDTDDYDDSLNPFITEACEYGLFRGNNGNFSPRNNITEAEALVVIIRSLYGFQEENRSPWYSEYFSLGEELGIIDYETLTSISKTPITREKLATWVYRAYHSDATEDVTVYETEVEGPDDCSSFETYDAKRNMCSYSCSTPSECESIESQINAELEGWTESLEGESRDAPQSEDAPTQGIKAVYQVSQNETISLTSGKDALTYRNLWKEVADLSPDALSDTYIEAFETYEDPSSDVIAFVSDDDGNGKWKISINLPIHTSSDIKEQKSTLIHELSHIITLNSSQFMSPTGACPNYETDEGCMKASSYVHQFVKKFWGNKKTDDYVESKFVSEYATTSPEEDIAESFAFYVLEANFSNANTREQKLSFFNTFPEIIQMRKDMRNTLASDIIRAKKLEK